jgi:putative spermidine/putrescine transport system permease protein
MSFSMSTVSTPMVRSAPLINRDRVIDWLGIAPFIIFSLLFLIIPTLYLVAGAFLTPEGDFTLKNIGDLFTPSIMSAYSISIRVSVASALGGALIGFFLAWAVVLGGLPASVRSTLLTFSGVASNFAGVPLAFAFLATLGRTGLVTIFLREWFGFNLYGTGFNLLSFLGLTITYMYFQIPLMVLILTPALDGMKKEWREASQILGATNRQYWTMVALPILWPSLLGTTLLLFANAFGAIALGMIVITGVSNVLYLMLRMRAERWQK